MSQATQWDIWHGGLLPEGTPEPPGRRSAAELAALQAGHDRNFAFACFQIGEAERLRHGEPQPERGTTAQYAQQRYFMERLGFGAD